MGCYCCWKKEGPAALQSCNKHEQPPPPKKVDRYKQLLLKQRDIMIALTARLNERDEQIMTLQVRGFEP